MKSGDTNTAIGGRLKEAREGAGYATASDAARAFGWNINTYGAAENGNRAPGRLAALRYAKAFRVSLDWLLTGHSPKVTEWSSIAVGFAATGRAEPAGRPRSGTTSHSGAIPLHPVPILESSDLSHLPPLNERTGADFAEVQKTLSGVSKRRLLDWEPPQNVFAFEVPRDHDDSMVDGGPRSLFPGDEVFVDPCRQPRPDDIVLARDGKRGVIRMLLKWKTLGDKRRAILAALNAEYGTLEIDVERIVGPVTVVSRGLLV